MEGSALEKADCAREKEGSAQQPLEKADSAREMDVEVVAAAVVDSAQEPQETPVEQEPQETPVTQEPQETPVKAAEAGSSVKAAEAGSAEAGAPVDAPRAEAAASSAASSNAQGTWLNAFAKRAAEVTVQELPVKTRRTQKQLSAGQRKLNEL